MSRVPKLKPFQEWDVADARGWDIWTTDSLGRPIALKPEVIRWLEERDIDWHQWGYEISFPTVGMAVHFALMWRGARW